VKAIVLEKAAYYLAVALFFCALVALTIYFGTSLLAHYFFSVEPDPLAPHVHL